MSGPFNAQLEHVQLAMRAQEEALARSFYYGLLGLEEVEKPAALVMRGGIWLSLGDRQLHLDVEEPFRPARKAHPRYRSFVSTSLPSSSRPAGTRCVGTGRCRGSNGSTRTTRSATGWSLWKCANVTAATRFGMQRAESLVSRWLRWTHGSGRADRPIRPNRALWHQPPESWPHRSRW